MEWYGATVHMADPIRPEWRELLCYIEVKADSLKEARDKIELMFQGKAITISHLEVQ